MNRQIEGYGSVALDERSGMNQALGHLASLGHRRTVYVSGPSDSWANRQRRTRFTETAEELGLEGRVVGPFQPNFAGGVIAADAVLIDDSTTAIVAYNDLMACGLVSRLVTRGVTVPGDMSVVGADDSLLAEVSRPQLTSIATMQGRIGRAAAQLVLGLVAPRSPGAADDAPMRQELVIPEGFLVRESTGPVRS